MKKFWLICVPPYVNYPDIMKYETKDKAIQEAKSLLLADKQCSAYVLEVVYVGHNWWKSQLWLR